MAASVSGIQNFAKMNDKDKAYLVKLIGTIFAAIIAGIISGTQFSPDSSFSASDSATTGWLIWIISTLLLSWFIKFKYNLEGMTNLQIVRHGIMIGLLNYVFFWTVVFNFLLF